MEVCINTSEIYTQIDPEDIEFVSCLYSTVSHKIHKYINCYLHMKNGNKVLIDSIYSNTGDDSELIIKRIKLFHKWHDEFFPRNKL